MKDVKIPTFGNTLISLMIDYSSLWQIRTEAARIATGTTKLVSIENLNSENRWDTLEAKRKKQQKLTLFYKMVHKLAPNYLTSLIPSTVNETSNYNLRNSNDIRTVNARTSQYFSSFLPSSIREWNALLEEQRNATTVTSFRYQLNQPSSSIPKFIMSESDKLQFYTPVSGLNVALLIITFFSEI